MAQPGLDCCYLLEVEVLVLVQLDVRGDGMERELVLHQLDVQIGQVGRLPAPLWLNLPPLSPPEESFRPWQLERQRGPKEGERDPAKSSLVLTHDLLLICF